MEQRNTIQMQVVYSTLHRLANHPTAEEVYDALHDEYPTISKATVYRVLNKLADNGSIVKLPMDEGPARFDHMLNNHYHVHCLKCGAVCDVNLPATYDINAHAAEQTGYQIEACHVVFSGVCPACQGKVAQEDEGRQ